MTTPEQCRPCAAKPDPTWPPCGLTRPANLGYGDDDAIVKGQMTHPKAAREYFGLTAGDRLGVIVEEGRIILVPLT